METVIQVFAKVVPHGGDALAQVLAPEAPASIPEFLYDVRRSTTSAGAGVHVRQNIERYAALPYGQAELWTELFTAWYRCIDQRLAAEEASNAAAAARQNGVTHTYSNAADSWKATYHAWLDVVNVLLRGFSSGQLDVSVAKCLYTATKFLRAFAMRADGAVARARAEGETAEMDVMRLSDDMMDEDEETNETLEDAARQINRIFSICINDRAPIQSSRKWALYNTANTLFRIYFRLNKLSLTKNILQSLSSAPDIPAIIHFPKSQHVTYLYYQGIVAFLGEDYAAAETTFLNALHLLPPRTQSLHPAVAKNHDLIMLYLIPTKLLTTHQLPSAAILSSSADISALYAPVVRAIRAGDLKAFDDALERRAAEFAKLRVYLTLERARDICMRNVLRRVYLTLPGEDGAPGERTRRSRVYISEFIAGLRIAEGRTQEVIEDYEDDSEHMECILANMIFKNHIKGYIARNRGIVVLARTGVFPGTGI